MNQTDYQQVIEALDEVIADTRQLMGRFEDTGMDEAMAHDYFALHELYTRSVKEQRDYTLAMLCDSQGGRDTYQPD